MLVDVSLCAVLRHSQGAYGQGEQTAHEGEMEVPEGATVTAVVSALGLPEGLTTVACVNGKMAPADTPLAQGDQVYVFLPVSGG
jgi:sulfur carrier protein ThiS